MKRQLISSVNSVLLVTLLLTVVFGELTKVSPPSVPKEPKKFALSAELRRDRLKRQALPVSQIYGKRNIFGLPWDTPIQEKSELAPSPELAELKLPDKPAPARLEPKESFIEALNISINGIITSSNEENNACIVSEGEGGEKMYKSGDTIQDGIVMNITRNSVSIIRPNGQLETFKVGEVEEPNQDKKPHLAITKLEDNSFIVDHIKFSKEVKSMGQLIEELGVMPSYKDGLCLGMRVTKSEPESISEALGFQEDDLILSTEGIKLCNAQDRIDAYDKIMNLKYNDSFTVELERGSEKVVNSYKLEKHKPKSKSLAERLGMSPDGKDSEGKDGSKTDKSIISDKKMSTFTRPAEDRERYSSNISAIRKRLLENANKQRITHLR